MPTDARGRGTGRAERVTSAMPSSSSIAITDITYNTLIDSLQSLARQFPHLASAWTTQQRYGLPSAGKCGNSIITPGRPCEVWVLEITHLASLERNPQRPDVLISGALHGDERVGPLVTLETAKWLLGRYEHDAWARRLVHTRRLLLVPAANAVGFHQHRREELMRDPNRDFPFEQEPRSCMLTVAGRSINELFRRHLIQLAITYHGGMEAVGYVWGDFAHRNDRPARNRSPDDTGVSALANAASAFAGRGPRGRNYPAAPMNSIVYPVAGGMEDWGYAASWEPHHVKACEPSTLGGYDKERTAKYDNATARAVVLLVETSDDKAPSASSLGRASSSSIAGGSGSSNAGASTLPPWPIVDLFAPSPSPSGDGHVPRNVRFALAAIDLVRPHVQLEVEGASLDLASNCVRLRWRVWGAMRADETYAVWRDGSTSKEDGSWRLASTSQSGAAVWGGGAAELTSGRGFFSACVKPPAEQSSTSPRTILLAGAAIVDQSWGKPPPLRTTPPQLGPQSHLVRGRTDPSWRHAANGREVRGQTRWLSDVAVEVECNADGSLVGGAALKTRMLTADGQLKPKHPRRRGH